jgi:hypothetical protein
LKCLGQRFQFVVGRNDGKDAHREPFREGSGRSD